jgi:hypothetical protein
LGVFLGLAIVQPASSKFFLVVTIIRRLRIGGSVAVDRFLPKARFGVGRIVIPTSQWNFVVVAAARKEGSTSSTRNGKREATSCCKGTGTQTWSTTKQRHHIHPNKWSPILSAILANYHITTATVLLALVFSLALKLNSLLLQIKVRC